MLANSVAMVLGFYIQEHYILLDTKTHFIISLTEKHGDIDTVYT